MKEEKIKSYLQKALKEIEQSVQVFEQLSLSLSPSLSPSPSPSLSISISTVQHQDSSTRLEHLHSLQLHAGIVCMMRRYMDAQGLWQKAIDKARENVGSLHVGIHYERLAVILYNAAICFAESQDYQEASHMIHEAREIVKESLKEKFDHEKKERGREKEKKEEENNNNNQMQELRSILTLIDSFDRELEDLLADSKMHMIHRRQHQELALAKEEEERKREIETESKIGTKIGTERERKSTNTDQGKHRQERGRERESESESLSIVDADNFPKLRAIKTEQGVKYIHEDIQGKGGIIGQGEDDDYEWEECSEFDTDGCEPYLVIEGEEQDRAGNNVGGIHVNRHPSSINTEITKKGKIPTNLSSFKVAIP
jgi:tetratricopeptide (TPR) repeat protein